MDAMVWVSSWQQQCCGERFQVGSSVRWAVKQHQTENEWASLVLGPALGTQVEFTEDHHDGDVDGMITGTVFGISVITCDRVLGADPEFPYGQLRVPKSGSGRLRSVEDADPWEPEPSDEDAGWSFDGWLVTLTSAGFEKAND